MSKRPAVTTKRIIRLYKETKSFAAVGRKVNRHLTSVRQRLVRAGVVEGKS